MGRSLFETIAERFSEDAASFRPSLVEALYTLSSRAMSSSRTVDDEIRAMVDRETEAWNARDAAALAALFHPDMVWPWPRHSRAHDPVDWVMPLGRFDRARWMAAWQSLFDHATLVRNDRSLVKVIVSEEGDGAMAVVDIDTLWKMDDGTEDNWKGRVGKVYSKLAGGEWKITMHTGVLEYGLPV